MAKHNNVKVWDLWPPPPPPPWACRSSEIDSDAIWEVKIAILFSTLNLQLRSYTLLLIHLLTNTLPSVNVIGLKIAIESPEKLSD